MTSRAPTELSRASTLIGRHAKLGGIASHRSLVSNTLESGLRIVSASTTGGYGNSGAWGVIRKISTEEFQEAIKSDLPQDDPLWRSTEMHDTLPDDAARFILEDGSVPLWHIVIEDMLRPKVVMTSFFVIENVLELLKDQMQERIFDFLDCDSNDFSATDFEQELLNLEPLLKEFYNQQKADGKWKGQFAYRQHLTIGRQTLLNVIVQIGRSDLLSVLLKFTHEGEHGGPLKPWFVLADVAFGSCVIGAESGAPCERAEMQADIYGNTAFHCCVYAGKVYMLGILLQHLQGLQDKSPSRFNVLLGVLARGVTASSKHASPATVLETAVGAKSWACYDAVKSVLQKHKAEFYDLLAEMPDPAYVERDVDVADEGARADLLKAGECHLVIEGQQFVMRTSGDFLAELENLMSQTARMARVELRVKGFAWRGATTPLPEEVLEKFLAWCFKFQSVIFTTSELSAPIMEQVLISATKLIQRDDPTFVCTKLGVGIRRMNTMNGDGAEVPGSEQPPLSIDVVKDLLAAVVELLPRERSLDVTIHRDWGLNLSHPKSKYILNLFGCITPILEFCSPMPHKNKSKGRNTSSQQNPLAENPFMPGLCRLKTVAFEGTWRSLCGAHTLSDAVSEETFPFLQAICELWKRIEHAWHPPQKVKLEKHLLQARGFIRKMDELSKVSSAKGVSHLALGQM